MKMLTKLNFALMFAMVVKCFMSRYTGPDPRLHVHEWWRLKHRSARLLPGAHERLSSRYELCCLSR